MSGLKKGLAALAVILATCISSKGQDSLKVPLENLRRANLIFVEYDECQELSDSLRSAILSAQNALHSKNLEISTLKDQKLILEQISGNKDKIITNLNLEVTKQKGLKIGGFVVAIGALVWAVIK